MRSLLNFGIALMANSGATYGPRPTAGQILATGLAAGEASRTASEEAASSRQQTAFSQQLDTAKENLAQTLGLGNLDVSRGTLGVAKGELSLKAQELAYKLSLLRNQALAAQPLLDALTGRTAPSGAPAGGAAPAAPAGPPATPGATPAAPGDPAWLKAIGPAPVPTADFSTFKDAATRDKIIAVAKAEGVDPNVALAYALRESQGNPAVQPGDGGRSRGAFQIGAPEAASVGVTNPDDPDQNILAGVRYIKQLQNDPKYGADPATTLLAYTAGKGAADQILAGNRPAPAIIAQHVANMRAVQAQNPAGVGAPPAPGAPAPQPGGPGYDPSTGLRTRGTPDAPGLGMPAPTIQDSLAALPPDIRGIYATRLSTALSSGDPAQVTAVQQDLEKAVVANAVRPRWQAIPEATARITVPGYKPNVGYKVNLADGEVKEIGTAPPPIDPATTPEALNANMMRAMAQKRLDATEAGAQESQQQLSNIALMKPLAAAAGPANQFLAQHPEVLHWLTSMPGVGTPEQVQRWTMAQVMDGLANYMAFGMKPAGIVLRTNQELNRLLAIAPGLGDTPEGREMKLAIMQTGAQRRVDENSFAQKYIAANGPSGLGSLDDAMDKQLGPVIPTAPPVVNPKAATPAEDQAFRTFRGGLHPGALYYDAGGNLQMKRGN